MSTDALIELTDSVGRAHDCDLDEPNPGSVVLTNGDYGTAWQRYFSDGLWYRVGGNKPKTWEWLLTHRNLRLAYDAAERIA